VHVVELCAWCTCMQGLAPLMPALVVAYSALMHCHQPLRLILDNGDPEDNAEAAGIAADVPDATSEAGDASGSSKGGRWESRADLCVSSWSLLHMQTVPVF
jgi:hypothetical protein